VGHNPPVPLPLSPPPVLPDAPLDHQLVCSTCAPARYLIVDQIRLLDERGDAFTPEHYDRMKCRHCGARLNKTGGLGLDAMQFAGKMPRLIVAGGSAWRWPTLAPPPALKPPPHWAARA